MTQEAEDKYAGGTILDPRDGKVYKATMKITPDGQTLVVQRPRGKDVADMKELTQIRHFLERSEAPVPAPAATCRPARRLPRHAARPYSVTIGHPTRI